MGKSIRLSIRLGLVGAFVLLSCGLGDSAQASMRSGQSGASVSEKLAPKALSQPATRAKSTIESRRHVGGGRPIRVRKQPAEATQPKQDTAASASQKFARTAKRATVAAKVAELRQRYSFGQKSGLHATPDPLDLKSGVALVLDQDSQEILLSKNSGAILPIASLTKLMTALVVVEAQQSLEEMVTISPADVDMEKGSHSRLSVGTSLTRGQMLQLALMSSENRAAHALGRYFPGGLPMFVNAMNRKAAALGMSSTRYVEPTGLSSDNQSSAADLAVLVQEAHRHELIRNLSVAPQSEIQIGAKSLQFRNTNGLVRSSTWDIGLQKTGYIVEAGRCLVMQASVAGRRLIMVFLDSADKYSRIADAERVRQWISDVTRQADTGLPRGRAAMLAPGVGS